MFADVDRPHEPGGKYPLTVDRRAAIVVLAGTLVAVVFAAVATGGEVKLAERGPQTAIEATGHQLTRRDGSSGDDGPVRTPPPAPRSSCRSGSRWSCACCSGAASPSSRCWCSSRRGDTGRACAGGHAGGGPSSSRSLDDVAAAITADADAQRAALQRRLAAQRDRRVLAAARDGRRRGRGTSRSCRHVDRADRAGARQPPRRSGGDRTPRRALPRSPLLGPCDGRGRAAGRDRRARRRPRRAPLGSRRTRRWTTTDEVVDACRRRDRRAHDRGRGLHGPHRAWGRTSCSSPRLRPGRRRRVVRLRPAERRRTDSTDPCRSASRRPPRCAPTDG